MTRRKKKFNEIQKEPVFLICSPSFPLILSERAASVLASEKRDTWKRFGVQISFQEGNMFGGFIGLLKVAIT